jgi:hypothetical protein
MDFDGELAQMLYKSHKWQSMAIFCLDGCARNDPLQVQDVLFRGSSPL